MAKFYFIRFAKRKLEDQTSFLFFAQNQDFISNLVLDYGLNLEKTSADNIYNKIVGGNRLMNIKNKHGLAKKTKLYGRWVMMKQRCYNPNNKDYYNYGARGIKVCDEWRNNYLNFHNWAYANGYNDTLSIDRIDVNGDYKPINCRWVDKNIQANNKVCTIYIDYEGNSVTLTELSNITGIKRETLEMRYIRGDRGERLYRPVRTRAS